ncbi:hypothetical protein BCR32DRAFT_270514 [Anaeromyces robustus]|uniref:EGF-like domain-containing protein n=1 Tax=Anaeromyces robustus TaxID=1754192 RepID=A0A1Y1WWH0_9FUNG|nr:hypothetical protein BCR32DRAFT_270514 [Anaeromyces robustus]|eukprot:ORX77658.1 hypothetical protein BCR32DRAFT_270514 [Anaeromyces robustus]
MEIIINSCSEHQIKMFKNNDIYYCENPICKSSCPVKTSAKCLPYIKEGINDINKNICVCTNGWTGNNCSEKIFVNFSNFEKILYTFNIPFLIIICAYIIFIIINRNNNIVKDTGLFKILLLSLGVILYFSSTFFETYNDYSGCTISFLNKHLGSFLVLIILYIYNELGHELGIKSVKDDKFTMLLSSVKSGDNSNITDNQLPSMSSSLKDVNQIKKTSSTDLDKFPSNNNLKHKEGINGSSERYYQSNDSLLASKKSFFSVNNIKKLVHENSRIGNFLNRSEDSIDYKSSNLSLRDIKNIILKKDIRNSHSIILESLIIYFVYIATTLLIIITFAINESNSNIIYESEISENDNIINNKHLVQNIRNGEWSYKCNLDTYDLFYNIVDLILLIIILLRGKQIYHFQCIFKCTKFITYSSILFVFLGPIFNIISITTLNNERFGKTVFEIFSNSLGFLIIFVLFSWDKIYYIIKKEGNDNKNYFILRSKEKCVLHNSYRYKYIDFYNLCSKLFIKTDDKKIKYFDLDSKIQYITDN